MWGTIEGLGTLVLGYNPATGDWFSGDAYGAAWGSLGLLVASGVMNSPVLGPLLWADQGMEAFGGGGFLPQEVRDFKAQADEAALNTGKALIAWDQWADDPGTALGESVFNVGTILIPAGAAIAGVKTAGTAASVLSKMARVVDLIDPASLAVNGAVRLGGVGLGSLDNLIGGLDLGAKLDPPHIEVYTAADSASAIRALDDWGVDLNTVTAHVDDFGTHTSRVPRRQDRDARRLVRQRPRRHPRGGRRSGCLDHGARSRARARPRRRRARRDRPGPGNSIVDEAPVRTETGGSGESTVVREPETTSGRRRRTPAGAVRTAGVLRAPATARRAGDGGSGRSGDGGGTEPPGRASAGSGGGGGLGRRLDATPRLRRRPVGRTAHRDHGDGPRRRGRPRRPTCRPSTSKRISTSSTIGAVRFMTEANLDKYGIAQRDGTSFILPKREVDDLMASTNGDLRALEEALGLPDGFLDSGVVRIDIPASEFDHLRMPSGNEAGANPQWIPGGHLPTGVSEPSSTRAVCRMTSFEVTPVYTQGGLMKFVDAFFSRAERYSLGEEVEAGRLYLSIPVSNGPVDYEEFYELSREEYDRFLAEPEIGRRVRRVVPTAPGG